MINPKRIFKAFLIAAVLTTLSACDPGSSLEYTIENNSSKQLILVHSTFGEGEIILNPGDSKIAKESKMGSHSYLKKYFKDYYCPCGSDSTKLFVTDTSFRLTKKLNDCEAWSHHDKKKKGLNKGGDFYCTFSVTDQDIH